jgi:HEAT repeat protein
MWQGIKIRWALWALRKSPTWKLRKRAAKTLGEAKEPRAVEPLIAALRDPNSEVRSQAAWALIWVGDVRAVEPLIVALKDNVTWSAAALGHIGDTRAVEPLIQTLESRRGIRMESIEALGRIGDTRAVEPLIETLESKDAYVRRAAIESLGEIKDTQAVEPIMNLVTAVDPRERRAAAMALGRFADARSVPYLEFLLFAEAYGYVRQAAAQALGQIGDAQSAELLVEALNDSYEGVRETAAQALEQMGDNSPLRRGRTATGEYRLEYNELKARRAAIDWWFSPESRLFWNGRTVEPGDGANCGGCGRPIRPTKGFLCMPQKLVCEQCFDSKGFVAFEPSRYDRVGRFKFAPSLRFSE